MRGCGWKADRSLDKDYWDGLSTTGDSRAEGVECPSEGLVPWWFGWDMLFLAVSLIREKFVDII